MQVAVGQLLVSPRRRRRLGRAGAVLAAIGGVVLLGVVFPGQDTVERTPELVRVAPAPRPIELTAADRTAITALLDRFVPAGVMRRDPGLAFDLAAPLLRGDSTRTAWLAGEVPLYPYKPSTSRFGHWTLEYANTEEVGLELLLLPAPAEPQGAIVFKVGVRKARGAWRVSSFYPAATYARDDEQPRMQAQADWAPPVPRG
jgi:hypothetical protein